MNAEEFRTIVADQTGLDVEVADLIVPFDDVAGWDSVYLLKLITALEQRTGRAVSVTAMLDATSLDEIRRAVAA